MLYYLTLWLNATYVSSLKSFETVDEERRQARIAARREAANRRAAEMTPDDELEAITEKRIKYVSDSLISKVRLIKTFYEHKKYHAQLSPYSFLLLLEICGEWFIN